MVVTSNPNISNISLPNINEPIEDVPPFRYLGAWINIECNCFQVIKTQIEVVRADFRSMHSV